MRGDKEEKIRESIASLEKLQAKLYDRLNKGKPKSKLVDPKKTKIPGFSTYFKKG